MPRYRALSAAISLVALCLIAAPAAAQSSDWSAIAAAAKKEGQLSVYGSGIVTKSLTEKFQAVTGIQTHYLEGRTTEIRERIRTEQASGRVNADVTCNGAVTTTNMMRDGNFVDHGPLPALTNLKAPFADNGTLLPYTANALALVVNSKLVTPEQEPKSWSDLTDPKWKDKMLLDEPRVGGVGYVFFAVTIEKLGRGYQEAFAAQKPTIMADPALANRRIALGEFPLYVGFSFQDWKGLRTLPLRVVIPKEGALYSTLNAAVVKGAPHPNAARLFLNFLVEQEAQRVITGLGSLSTTGTESPESPPDVQALLKAPLWGASNPDDQRKMNALAVEIYGNR